MAREPWAFAQIQRDMKKRGPGKRKGGGGGKKKRKSSKVLQRKVFSSGLNQGKRGQKMYIGADCQSFGNIGGKCKQHKGTEPEKGCEKTKIHNRVGKIEEKAKKKEKKKEN